MNAETKVKAPKPDPNMRIWDALSKTDPSQTKPFKRAGGFGGTAVKPMWVIKRLTEQFGPCGVGWGVGEPSFQVVEGGGETLVYCTVQCWHNNGVTGANPIATLYGVGGDKVVTKRQSGPFCDDEAFKKAFTDAINNAFKFVGVAADIHMGQFDDSKYVAAVTKEFSAGEPTPNKPVKLDGPYPSKTALWGAVKAFVHTANGIADQGEWIAYRDSKDVKELLAQCARDAPNLLRDGIPDVPEYEPLEIFIARLDHEMEERESIANSEGARMIRAG